MEVLGFVLAIFLIVLYIHKVDQCDRLKVKLDRNEFSYFVVRLVESFSKPKIIGNLQWRLEMLSGKIKLTWVKSVSANVVGQPLVVGVDGVEVTMPAEVLAPEVESYEFFAKEGAAVEVSLCADNGSFKSDPVTLSFVVPVLAPPQPQTNLVYEVVEVVETPDDPVPPAEPV